MDIEIKREFTDNVTARAGNYSHYGACVNFTFTETPVTNEVIINLFGKPIFKIDYQNDNIIAPVSVDFTEFKAKLKQTFGFVGGFIAGPVQQDYIFVTEAARDTYFSNAANVNPQTPLNTGQQIIIDATEDKPVMQVWAGETVETAAEYASYSKYPWLER